MILKTVSRELNIHELLYIKPSSTAPSRKVYQVKLKRILVVLHLIKSKCVPVLLYAVEACPVNRSLQGSLEFPFTRILMKIFRTRSSDVVLETKVLVSRRLEDKK